MNIKYILGILLIIVLVVIAKRYIGVVLEKFIDDRKPKDGKPIQIGTLNNTPGPIKDLMMELNSTGGQLVADSQYDSVPKEYLDKNKIKN
jgi:hypothetical protein